MCLLHFGILDPLTDSHKITSALLLSLLKLYRDGITLFHYNVLCIMDDQCKDGAFSCLVDDCAGHK